MRTKLFLMLFALLIMAGTSYAHDLELLHVDGRYLKNPKGDIVTLHGWITNWKNLYEGYYDQVLDYEAHLAAWRLSTDSILAAGYKLDYARLHFGCYNPSDFDGFVQRGDFENLILPMVDYLNSKGIYVLLMCDCDVDDALRTERKVGESWQQRLLKYWDYASSHPRIKNNPGVMFELSNEPGEFRGSDGSMNDFRTLKAYYQPMVDLIRKNGCQQVIWIPGAGPQTEFAGFATFPIEGTNIGYAVHFYDWFWHHRNYEMYKRWCDRQMKAVSNMAPLIVTESFWEGRYGINYNDDDNYKQEDLPKTSDFGMIMKQIVDETGNVSWNITSEAQDMVNTGKNPSKPALYNDPEGVYMACLEWFDDYQKTKITKMSSLNATKVELQDVHRTVRPGDVRPITLMATFSDGRRWNVAGDAVWTSNDESVLSIKQGNLHVKSEGKVTVSGTYTDGTGKSFQVSFDVTSQLFPLTADGVKIMEGAYDEATHTFLDGWYIWESGGQVASDISGDQWTWNQRGGLDFSTYKYIVMRMNEPQWTYIMLELYDQVGGDNIHIEAGGKDEVVLNLHGHPNFDPSHVTAVTIVGGPVSVKEIFLSNDGVNPAPPYTMSTVVKAEDVTMHYGEEPKLTYTVSGYANVGTPTLSTTATKTSPIGTYDITVAAGGNADRNVTYKPGKLTIVPAPLTVKANDIVVGEGKEIPTLTLSYEGLRNSETAAETLSEQPVVTTTATKDSPCGNYEITVSGGSSSNYELAWHNGTLTITGDITLPEAYSAALAEADELLPQRMSDHARNTLQKAIALEQTYANYYRLTDALQQARKSIEAQAFATRALEVMKNELLNATNVCTPEGKEVFQKRYQTSQKAYDEEWLTDNMALNNLYNPYEGGGGLAIWDLLEFMMSAWEYNMSNTPYMEGAPYNLGWAAKADDGTGFNMPCIEYFLEEGKQRLEARTLKATMTDMEPGQYTVTARVRLRLMDGASGAPKGVTLQVCDGTAVNISGQRIGDTNEYLDCYTATGIVGSDGVLTIKFHVAADNNLSNLAFRDLWQEKGGPVTITANSVEIIYGDEVPALTYTSAGDAISGVPVLTTTATGTSPAGTYPIVVEQGTVERKNVSYVAGTLTVKKAPLTITADNKTKKQGDAMPELTATYKGFKNDETAEVLTKQPTLSCTATAASAPGTYPITVKGATAQNYDISFVNGTLTVTDADAITVTANSYTIEYGDALPEFAYTAEGAELNGKPRVSCSAKQGSPVGTYDIVITKGSVKNYNDTYVNGTLTITKAPLTVGVKDETITEGDAIPAFTLTYDGFKNNDTEASAFTKKPVASTTATSKSEAGTYPITVSGGEARNYALTYGQGTLVIEAPSVPKDVDLTDRVGTSQSDWNAGGVCATEYAPAITTSDGRQAQMMETYEETVETTGEMMYQVITGLENGDYAVEMYANAQYTDGRGFDSNLTDGARKVVYVSANDRRCYVTAHIGTAVSRNSICTVYTQVKDGTLRLGLTAEEPGTNWHTLQIKKLTLLRHGTVIYADDKTREEGTANPQWTYTVSGTAVTGKPTLSLCCKPNNWFIF